MFENVQRMIKIKHNIIYKKPCLEIIEAVPFLQYIINLAPYPQYTGIGRYIFSIGMILKPYRSCDEIMRLNISYLKLFFSVWICMDVFYRMSLSIYKQILYNVMKMYTLVTRFA